MTTTNRSTYRANPEASGRLCKVASFSTPGKEPARARILVHPPRPISQLLPWAAQVLRVRQVCRVHAGGLRLPALNPQPQKSKLEGPGLGFELFTPNI